MAVQEFFFTSFPIIIAVIIAIIIVILVVKTVLDVASIKKDIATILKQMNKKE